MKVTKNGLELAASLNWLREPEVKKNILFKKWNLQFYHLLKYIFKKVGVGNNKWGRGN